MLHAPLTKNVLCLKVEILICYFIVVLIKLTHFTLKTLWEKEKLLVMSNFSFSNFVFYPFQKVSANSFSSEESKFYCLGKS